MTLKTRLVGIGNAVKKRFSFDVGAGKLQGRSMRPDLRGPNYWSFPEMDEEVTYVLTDEDHHVHAFETREGKWHEGPD